MVQKNTINALFKQCYQQEPDVICYAPARVNIIGDHTDYNDGFVFPAAIDCGTTIAASKRDDQLVKVYSHDFGKSSTEFVLNQFSFDTEHMWCNYIKGSVQALMEKYPNLRGANLVVTGNVAQGAGLSSSASFEMAILKTFTSLYKLELDGKTAAKMGQQAENDYVGCNCGIMDQLISAMGKKGHAMLLDCRDLTFEDAPISDELSLVIINSNVKRGLVDSEYNLRREQCEQVAKHFGCKALRDVTLAQLESEKEQLSDVQYRRAKHVITENARTVAALTAFKSSDMSTLSQLMAESHQSLRDDFEVTTKEMDGLVDIVSAQIGNQGGVRMTGGGFGGCVVALMPKALVEKVTEQVNIQYPEQFGLTADIYICHASQGAFRHIDES
ncbi:galactokinase [Thalassotalea hakodatensis]|uniref:galactokinase n=1 Tax=Thalassotalea hakodatensis TaxID=3030492 RepID=UPI002573FE1B|nr:galactokinase [Thalassotalea hakodatensis]